MEATGALLTFQSAIPLLAQFCSLLRTDKFAPLPKPHYTVDGFGRNWTCELRLPMIATLGGIVSYRSAGWVSKKGARQAAAFEACVELHRKGAISDSLLPVRESRTEAPKDVDGRAVQVEDVDKDGVTMPFETGFGEVMEGGEAWATVVELRMDGQGERRFGLVCARDLSAELEGEGGSLHAAGGGGTIAVNVIRSSKIEWSSEEERTTRLGQLHQLNVDAARTAINRRVEDANARFTALWVPLTAGGEVDWSVVEQPFSPVELASLEEGQLVVLLSRWPSLRLGKLVQVRQDVNTLSETSLIENTLNATSKRRKLVKS